MKSITDNILSESENSSDAFFQNKHLNKREEEFRSNNIVFFNKLKDGLQKIKEDYKDKKWKNEYERLFLKMFSKVHIDEEFCDKCYGYLLSDENSTRKCLYLFKNDRFFINYHSDWNIFTAGLQMKYYEAEAFISGMLLKYSKMYPTTLSVSDKLVLSTSGTIII